VASRLPKKLQAITNYFLQITNSYICLMQVDDALIEKLAELSMLRFDETEKEEIKADLQKMIGL
jgi:hypothetical protein